MSMCSLLSCVVGRRCLLWPVRSLGKTLLAFALLHFVLQGQICPLLQVFLDFLLLHSSPLWWKVASKVATPIFYILQRKKLIEFLFVYFCPYLLVTVSNIIEAVSSFIKFPWLNASHGILVGLFVCFGQYLWHVSMPQPVTLKKLKLNGSMKTYKTF